MENSMTHAFCYLFFFLIKLSCLLLEDDDICYHFQKFLVSGYIFFCKQVLTYYYSKIDIYMLDSCPNFVCGWEVFHHIVFLSSKLIQMELLNKSSLSFFSKKKTKNKKKQNFVCDQNLIGMRITFYDIIIKIIKINVFFD